MTKRSKTPPFHCKQFTVEQDRCAMKVGTDGMLLGAWAPLEGARRMLDIGTGTGLIALMLAQRAPQAQIDGVEIDPVAAQQARENVAASPFASRIEVQAGAIQTHPTGVRYDLIVSNPPFFTAGILPPNAARRQARHAQSLDLDTLLQQTSQRLAPRGHACFIFPAEQSPQWEIIARRYGLHLQQRLVVRPTPLKTPHRVLTVWAAEPTERLVEAGLVIRELQSQQYTEAYRALTEAFYTQRPPN
jgi:tRNA1Val (adenine37-N6)-methyltransferase